MDFSLEDFGENFQVFDGPANLAANAFLIVDKLKVLLGGFFGLQYLGKTGLDGYRRQRFFGAKLINFAEFVGDFDGKDHLLF